MRASFRDVLLVAIIIIVLVPVGVVAAVSYMNGEATVRRLSTFVLRQTSDRIREEVGGLLERAALMIESCSAYIATPPSDDWSGIRRMDAK
jgi:hypothetical protein